MKLYYSPGACSLAVHIVLRELGAKFELERVDLPSKKTASGADYRKVNPKGYVPALVLDDGQVLTEANVICQYLADKSPDAGLAPPLGTMERYRLMEWLSFTSSEVHKQLGALFNPKLTAEMREVQLEVITRRLDTLEKMLAGRSYAMGERFTVADAYLVTVLSWTNVLKVDDSRWPGIRGYRERVRGRPKVQEALKAESLVS